MSDATSWNDIRLTRLRISPLSLTALALVIIGLALGSTLHKGFMILTALGAFGPGVLRQIGLMDDLDEFQQSAAAQAGFRAYLVGGLFSIAIVIAGGWNHLSLSNDEVPASAIVTILLVVYYASYCLCFWDVQKAVSRIMFAFGLLWFAFSVASASDLMALATNGLVLYGPFILGALLCKWWPRTIGYCLLSASVFSVFFFHLLPPSEGGVQHVFRNIIIMALVSLPLAITGVALVASERADTNDHTTAE